MDLNKVLEREIRAASGEVKAELVLKNGKVVNVFTNELEEMDVAIEAGYIVGLGEYEGKREIDLGGKILCPGFIDGHIHLESSMVSPSDFQAAVVPHGTTSVITDPHEITNVAGTAGIEYMMKATKNLDLDVYFMLPSCVPATPLDESGAVLDAEALRPFYRKKRVLGLAELMNSYGTIHADEGIIAKVKDARARHKMIDGHAPFLAGKGLNAYIVAGVTSDHECSECEEAKEKYRRGQWIMIREGTAAKNLDALMPLFHYPYCNHGMLVTDDKHPGDLIRLGHIDYIIKSAVQKGANPIRAIKMGSYNTAKYFGIKNKGAIAPGFEADLVVIDDFESFKVQQVYKEGRLVAEHGSCINVIPKVKKWNDEIKKRVFDSFHMAEITEKDLELKVHGPNQRVIKLQANELLTEELIVPWKERIHGGNSDTVSKEVLKSESGSMPGNAVENTVAELAPGVDIEHDIIKLAVFERHHNTGHVGLGFVNGYGLKKGAVASSIAHDSHNLIIAGTNDRDMMIAGNCVRGNKGGLAVVVDGQVIGELALPIGGLMTDASVYEVEEKLQDMKTALKQLGIPDDIDAFMTLAFTSLPVIPKLRLNTYGIIDVERQEVVEATF